MEAKSLRGKKRATTLNRWPKVRVDLSKLFQKRGDIDVEEHENYDTIQWESDEGQCKNDKGLTQESRSVKSKKIEVWLEKWQKIEEPDAYLDSPMTSARKTADIEGMKNKSPNIDFKYNNDDNENTSSDRKPSLPDCLVVEPKQFKNRSREFQRRGSVQERARFLCPHKLHFGMLVSHVSSQMRSIEYDQLSKAVLLSVLPLEKLDEWFSRCQENTVHSLKGVILDVLDWISTIYERPVHNITKEWKLLQLRYLVQYISTSKPRMFTNKIEPIKRDYDALISLLKKQGPTFSSQSKYYVTDFDQTIKLFQSIDLDLNSVYPNRVVSKLDFSVLPTKLKVNSFIYVKTFLLIMHILGIFGRMIWTMDSVLMPSKFIPAYSFVNSLLSHQSLHTSFSTLYSGSKKKAPSLETACDEDYPTLWAEIYHSPSEQWIPVDVLRTLVDSPLFSAAVKMQYEDQEDPPECHNSTKFSVLTRGRKRLDCVQAFPPSGHTFGFDQFGRVAHLSLIYSRRHTDTLRRIADPSWLDMFLQKWNQQQKEHLKYKDFETALWDKQESIDKFQSEKVILKEPPPRFIQAYRGHPLYCLERYKKKYEVSRPDAKVVHYIDGEPVFRRNDICLLKTSNNWFQEGMQVKKGETPIMVQPKRFFRNPKPDDGRIEMNHYYAPWQVEPFEPEPALDGRIPLNVYGNVYLFKPNMLPKGTVHLIGYSNVRHICKKLGFNCAPAMIGWLNQLPNLYGWVVCQETARTIVEACLSELQKKQIRSRLRRREKSRQCWLRLVRHIVIQRKLNKTYGNQQNNSSFDSLASPTCPNYVPAPSHPSSLHDTVNVLLPGSTDLASESLRAITPSNHTHIFPNILYQYDEAKGIITRTCPCGFKDTLRQLSMIKDECQPPTYE